MAYPYFGAGAYPQIPQTPMPAPQQNLLPPQQVLRASGKASIDALRMSPNSSILVMDTTAPIVWLCTSDGIGTVSAQAYDITAHTEAPEAGSVEARLCAAEAAIARIKEVLEHDKSDDAGD